MRIDVKKLFTFIIMAVAFLGFLIILGAFWDNEYYSSPRTSSHKFPAGISANLTRVIKFILNKSAMLEEPLIKPVTETSQQKTVTWTTYEYTVRLKSPKILSSLMHELSDAIYANGGEIFQTYTQPKAQKATLVVGLKTFITHRIVFTWHTPRIAEAPSGQTKPADSDRQFTAAIIIDDLGSSKYVVYRLLDFQEDFTFSILPHLKQSAEIATILHERQKEILLHLPMEPRDYPEQFPGKGAIMMAMSPEIIHQTIEQNLQTVPFVVGVNNHMGSRITSDHEKMHTVLQTLHRHNLFFLDSRTTNASVAYRVAQQLGVVAAERKIFLDAEPGFEFVKKQLRELASLAEQGKPAIAIGHPKEVTLQALEEILPEFKQRNVTIVRVSQFIH